MKKNAIAPLGAAAQRKLEKKALRDKLKLSQQAVNAKKAEKAAKKAPAKKAAKKVAKPAAKVAQAPAGKGKAVKLDLSTAANRMALGFTAVNLARVEMLENAKAKAAAKPEVKEFRAAPRVQPDDKPKVIGRPEVYDWDVVTRKQWQTMKDGEIAQAMGGTCTPVTVANRRKKLIAAYDQSVSAKDRKASGYVNPYECKRPKGSKTFDVAAEIKKRQKVLANA